MANLPVEVVKATDANLNGTAVMLTAKIAVDPTVPGQMAQALSQIRSKETKELVFEKRYDFNLSNYGVANSGGPRPIRKDDKPDGDVVGYALDFKFSKGI